jgi:hypothetical protein
MKKNELPEFGWILGIKRLKAAKRPRAIPVYPLYLVLTS